MSKDQFLILHGWGGNKPAHWQEHLAAKLSAEGARVYCPKMPEPTAPHLLAWLDRLTEEVETIRKQGDNTEFTVLTHSLGSILWMHYADRNSSSQSPVADRVLLVAPPYVMKEAPPLDAPESVVEFFPPPLSAPGMQAVAFETNLVASDTDDYATFDLSSGYAAKLKIPIHLLKGAGHISPYYGYGEWPWVLEWCMRRADLPPQPRPAE